MLPALVTLAPLLSIVTVAVAGVFSLLQWLDVRRREVRQRRWTDYTLQLSIAGGSRPDGSKVTIFDQTAALYQLLEYPEFAFTTVRALENVDLNNPLWKEWKDFSDRHLRPVLASLRSQKAYIGQATRFKDGAAHTV